MEEYLTVKELSSRIKFSCQSLYNLISKGEFVLGKHYLKPTKKKVLFKWSEIKIWIGDVLPSKNNTSSGNDIICPSREHTERLTIFQRIGTIQN